MQPPDEGCNPESDNSITVEIIEATERRPKRVALGFYNVDHHIDIEQAIAMANDILEKTGEVAFQLKIEIPDSAFRRAVADVDIVVNENQIVVPVPSVEVSESNVK